MCKAVGGLDSLGAGEPASAEAGTQSRVLLPAPYAPLHLCCYLMQELDGLLDQAHQAWWATELRAWWATELRKTISNPTSKFLHFIPPSNDGGVCVNKSCKLCRVRAACGLYWAQWEQRGGYVEHREWCLGCVGERGCGAALLWRWGSVSNVGAALWRVHQRIWEVENSHMRTHLWPCWGISIGNISPFELNLGYQPI